MEKCAKDQADGKCSRTSPYPPTVDFAYARGIMAKNFRNVSSSLPYFNLDSKNSTSSFLQLFERLCPLFYQKA
jgi:hypothetical protein